MALKHLAIIMDGNRRWARRHTLRALAGHDQGAQNLKTIAKSVAEHGVDYLTVFAFSSENWKRSQAEISGLISLMRGFLQNDVQQLVDDNIKLLIIGDRSAFDDELKVSYTITVITFPKIQAGNFIMQQHNVMLIDKILVGFYSS